MKYPQIIRAIQQEITTLQTRIDLLRRSAHTLGAFSNHIPKKRKSLSVKARKRIAAAQKVRWAKWHEARKARG